MFDTYYKPMDKKVWQGRIDSQTNYDAFRWHQWIQPIDLREESISLAQEGLGFAFLGFCCDKGILRNKGRGGATKGPRSIRRELSNLPCAFSKKVHLFDAGNIDCQDCTLEEGQELLAKAVAKLLNLNLFPILLGGGHETALGHYNGLLRYLKEKENPCIGIINFDAHFDLRPYEHGGSSGTMFRQIADICKEKNLEYAYLCMGIQKHSNTVELFKTADQLGVEYILAKDMKDRDDFNILEALDEFMNGKDHIYITICSDVFASAFAPGVSAPQTLGLDPERVLKFLKYILRSKKVISFDIVEVSPRFDHDNTTSNLAKALIFSVIETLSRVNHMSISYKK